MKQDHQYGRAPHREGGAERLLHGAQARVAFVALRRARSRAGTRTHPPRSRAVSGTRRPFFPLHLPALVVVAGGGIGVGGSDLGPAG